MGVTLVTGWATCWAATPAQLPSGGVAQVSQIIDGDTVLLDDGRQVRLVGIQAPKLSLGRANFQAWPLGQEAKAYLQALVLGKTVELRLPPQPMDRHGRMLAHLLLRPDQTNSDQTQPDQTWVQGAMLAAGLARVYTFADNRLLAADMLGLEAHARADKIGMWGLPYYAVRTSDNARFDIGTFQLVEGRVLDVARIKNRIYLNFGLNWRDDFTIVVSTRDEKMFSQSGINLMNMKGRRVRVRGWLKSQNGPMIVLTHPERLELMQP